MFNHKHASHISDDAVRGATEHTGLLYVLGFSTGLAVMAMSLVWIIPALYHVHH